MRSLEDSDFKSKANPSIHDLIRIFISTPFKDWPAETTCAIAIDALDELVDHLDVGLVLTAFDAMNKPVKLFITSRPDVVVGVKGKKRYEIEEFEVESEANKEDIRIFTHDRLEEMVDGLDVSENDFKSLVATLAEASNGLFIWITLVLGDVGLSDKFETSEEVAVNTLAEGIHAGEVKETGKQLVERLQKSATLDLNSLYCRALFKAYPGSELVADFKTCFGVVLSAQVPLSVDAIHDILSYSKIDDKLPKTQVAKTFKLLGSLLKTDNGGKLSFIHKTVPDYLHSIGCHNSCAGADACISKSAVHCCHNQASSTFQIDFDNGSLDLALACLAILNGKLLFENMAKLDPSVKYNGQTFVGALTEPLQYAVLYWSNHFVAAFEKASSDDKNKLLEALLQLCQTKLPMYLEAVLLLGQLNSVVGVVNSVLGCLASVGQVDTIHRLLTDLKFIAFNFRPQLLVSPLQVYRHALIAVPQDTLYYQTYRELAPLGAHLTLGYELKWGPLTLYGHTSGINSVVISADGETVVSGSDDKTVKLWDTRTGECTRTLEGHTSYVYSVAISADGETVVSGSRDKTVKLWDTQTGKCLESFDSQTRSFDSVVNEILVAAGDRGSLGRVEFSDSWITDVSSKQLLCCPPSVEKFVSNGSSICWRIDMNVVALVIGDV
ncbi:UNVERIFIED_CONTAM: POC1 centriolar protein A [Siphonaria sp. JEL0065]|nr:POC1 centriolar protein A [Siphonaria sp. JEL0065]